MPANRGSWPDGAHALIRPLDSNVNTPKEGLGMVSGKRLQASLLATLTAAVLMVAAASCRQKSSGKSVAGVAHVLHGASSQTTSFRSHPSFVAPNGNWIVSPDRVRVHLDHISFNGASPSEGTGTDLTGCALEFDRNAPSLSSMLDCPFTLSRSVRALDVSLVMNPTFEILISDTANGIFTDPAAVGGLTNVQPAAGAAFVAWTANHGGTTAGGALPEAVQLGSNGDISLAIVMDAVQTVEVVVTGGVPQFNANTTWVPVVVFPTFDAPGRATYYSSAATAGSILVPAGYTAARVYYGPGANSQPLYLANTNACSVTAATGGVFPIDPAQSPVYSNGSRSGGWLGRDGTGTICWALPADTMWSSYVSYLTMPEITTLGSSGTLSCQATTATLPPTSGSNYSSGCPAITPDTSTTMTLVAR